MLINEQCMVVVHHAEVSTNIVYMSSHGENFGIWLAQ